MELLWKLGLLALAGLIALLIDSYVGVHSWFTSIATSTGL